MFNKLYTKKWFLWSPQRSRFLDPLLLCLNSSNRLHNIPSLRSELLSAVSLLPLLPTLFIPPSTTHLLCPMVIHSIFSPLHKKLLSTLLLLLFLLVLFLSPSIAHPLRPVVIYSFSSPLPTLKAPNLWHRTEIVLTVNLSNHNWIKSKNFRNNGRKNAHHSWDSYITNQPPSKNHSTRFPSIAPTSIKPYIHWVKWLKRNL